MGGEVVGKRISEVMPDIDPSVIQRIEKVALSGEPSRYEDFIPPLDRWFEIYLSRFGHAGSRTVSAVFRDITERKQRQRLQVFLLTLSDALRPLVDPQEIQVLAANLLGEHLQVNQASYGEVLGEYVHISYSYAKGLPPLGAGMEIVGSVGNGRDAVRVATALMPDVVLMDLTMPEMNGIEATLQICTRMPATQVVVLSMHSNREHVYQAMKAGAMGYVLKDAASAELVKAVRAVRAGRRYVSPAIGLLPELSGQRGPLESLSMRESQVLQLVVEGRTSGESAQAINLSKTSVDTYRSRLMKKLGVSDVASLVKLAVQHGLTPPG